ncbi:MAG TPA: DMT family transporter [Pseudolabrys sp.]|nr:DMT family transporter [Pseudolabrys sp.]
MMRGFVHDQIVGVSIAIVSSSLGGSAAAVTRCLARNTDPVTLAILRWGIGFALVLPTALLLRARFPPRSDWLAVGVLGICFFGLFFIFYNVALGHTTAARASLALSTLPLQTHVCRARLRAGEGAAERLARRNDYDWRRAVHGVLQRCGRDALSCARARSASFASAWAPAQRC